MDIIKNKLRDINSITFIILILIAIITRFIYLDKTAHFVNDQGRDLLILNEIVINSKLSLIGPATSFHSTLGSLYFGPYYYYFLLPFFLLSKDPIVLTAIFPILFILICTLLIKVKGINKNTKILFLIFSIFSSYSLYYSRFLWNLNLGFLLSFIVFLLFLLFNKAIFSKKIYLIIFGFICGMVFQVHYGMLFLYLALIIIFLKKKRCLYYLTGFFLSFLPFIIFDIRHKFIILKTLLGVILDFFQKVGEQNFNIFHIFSKLFNSYLIPDLFIHDFWKLLFGFILLILILKYLFTKNTILFKLLRYSFILFLVSFFIFKRNFDYYLACFFLFYYLGFSLFLSNIFSKKRNISYILYVFIIIFVITNLHYYFSQNNYKYSIYTQNRIAEAIDSKINSINSDINKINLSALPHHDDRKGVEYILLTRYKIQNYNKSRDKFIICYSRECFKKDYKLIYNVRDIGLYYVLE